MPKPMIAGNWKMNLNRKEALDLVLNIKNNLSKNLNRDILFAPSFTNLLPVKEIISDTDILLSAQNMSWEEKGAFTGEISPLQLKEIGCDFVIIGHSERRKIFLENDEILNKKVKTAIKTNLKVIFCIGETLEEREKNETYNILEKQIKEGLKDITEESLKDLVIAYEPVWAIGTGKTATPEQAEDVHVFIRKLLKDIFSEDFSKNIRILYGGSVKAENIDELMAKKNIDGVLVGGESLKADKFLRIINYKN